MKKTTLTKIALLSLMLGFAAHTSSAKGEADKAKEAESKMTATQQAQENIKKAQANLAGLKINNHARLIATKVIANAEKDLKALVEKGDDSSSTKKAGPRKNLGKSIKENPLDLTADVEQPVEDSVEKEEADVTLTPPTPPTPTEVELLRKENEALKAKAKAARQRKSITSSASVPSSVTEVVKKDVGKVIANFIQSKDNETAKTLALLPVDLGDKLAAKVGEKISAAMAKSSDKKFPADTDIKLNTAEVEALIETMVAAFTEEQADAWDASEGTRGYYDLVREINTKISGHRAMLSALVNEAKEMPGSKKSATKVSTVHADTDAINKMKAAGENVKTTYEIEKKMAKGIENAVNLKLTARYDENETVMSKADSAFIDAAALIPTPELVSDVIAQLALKPTDAKNEAAFKISLKAIGQSILDQINKVDTDGKTIIKSLAVAHKEAKGGLLSDQDKSQAPAQQTPAKDSTEYNAPIYVNIASDEAEKQEWQRQAVLNVGDDDKINNADRNILKLDAHIKSLRDQLQQ